MSDAQQQKDKLKGIVKAIKTLQTRTPEVQAREFKKLAQGVDRILTLIPSKFKRTWIKVQNLLKSLADGAPTGDLTTGVFKDAVIEVDNWADEMDAIDAKGKPSAGNNSTQTPLERWAEEQDSNTERTLRKYAPYKAIIPENIKTKFVVERAPILVVPQGGANIEKLKADKLLEDQVFSYPIIKNQLVLGIDIKWSRANFDNEEEAVQDVLDNIYERTNKKYTVLGVYRVHGSVHYYWIVDAPTGRRLAAGFYNKLLIKQWSFPFDSKADRVAMPADWEERQKELLKKAKAEKKAKK